ncbi:YesL family protein [Oceanobacillus chungangensis]|nr:YesL family protein [Oceanobacillus chungangensis]
MNVNGLTGSLNTILTWITRLALLNVLWIIFSIQGLLIAGIFPSTIAALTICRKWQEGEKDIPIWKTFKRIYRDEFLASNILGWAIMFMGLLLYLNFLVMSTSHGEVSIIIIIAFYLLTFLYINIIIWSFPLLSNYNGSIIQHMKNAIILGIVNIHYTLTILILLFCVTYVSLEFPGMILFFTVSIGALCWSWISQGIFKKMDTATN